MVVSVFDVRDAVGGGGKISSATQSETLHLLDVQLPKYEALAEFN